MAGVDIRVPLVNRFPQAKVIFSNLTLIILVIFIYRPSLGWWFELIDAPLLLIQSILYSPLDYFTSPASYELLTTSNLTPWVIFSWDIDYTLFGLNPVGFRVHHLLSFIIMMLLIHRLIYKVTRSLLAALLFSLAVIASSAAIELAITLINRHYIEGMILCLLSLLCVLRFNENNHFGWIILAAILYGLSTTAKEVYVPLPAIIFFLLPGPLKRRIILILPYAVVTALYLIWRFYMLRGSLGGYTSADIPELFGSPLPLSEAIFNIISTFFGNETASLLIVSAVIIVFLLTFTRLDLLTKLGLIGGAICLVVPLISLLPVVRVGLLHQRWFFLPITASLITTAYLSRLIVSNIGKTVIYIIIFIASVSSTLHYINYPPFILVDKMLPTAILQGHNSAYIDIRAPYNRAASRLYSHWVYLTKLDKGFWGTRVISVPGQMEYHDLANRIPIDSNLQALGSTKRDIPPNQKNLDLIKNISQPNPSQLRFEFSDNLHDTDCFIYIFGKNNGNATRNQPCQNWRISIYNLNRMVREIGYTLDDASLAIWVDNGQKRLFSKPYNLSTLFDRYGIVLDDSIRGPVDAPPNRFVPVVERIKARLPLGIRNILDRNVFEVTALEDIVHSQDGSTPPNTAASTPNDFFLGKNWYPLERFDGEIFRWVNNDAEIVVTAPAGAQRLLRLEVEPGPGLGSQPFTLYLQNNKGQAVAQTQVQKREIVSISLPPFDVEGTQLFRLHVEGGGLSTPNDPRTLNFRVFQLGWLQP